MPSRFHALNVVTYGVISYEHSKTPDPLELITPPEGRFYRIAVMARSRVRAFYGDVSEQTSMVFELVGGRWLVTRE
jgi:hypothetical protein